MPSSIFGMSISPLRHTISVDPGDEAVVFLDVTNTDPFSVTLIPEVSAFSLEKNGSISWNAVDDARAWVLPEGDGVTLRAGEHARVLFRVVVPKGAMPGSHYLGLFVRKGNSGGENAVALSERPGSLLFLHVAGTVQESVRANVFSEAIAFGKNISYVWKIENTGTVHAVPEIVLRLRTIHGKIIATQNSGADRLLLLPSGVREGNGFFSVRQFLPQAYIVEMSVRYGITKQESTASSVVWLIPRAFLIALSLLCAVIVYIFVRHIYAKK
mgnify:CR=1 FL=1